MTGTVNKFGRRGGRGFRPWLLIPKVLCVAMVFGGFMAALAVALSSTARTRGEWSDLLDVLTRIVIFAVVPGLIGAIVLGLLLLLQHPREFLRMRWLRVKLAIVVVVLPAMHFWVSGLMETMRTEIGPRGAGLHENWGPPQGWNQFRTGVVLAILVIVALVVLGRQKPRLGQTYGDAAAHEPKRGET